MPTYTNTEEIFNALTRAVGNMAKEVSKRKVVVAGESTIPKVDDEFILVDLTSAEQNDWQSNEWIDDQGRAVVTHNYEVVYTLTAYRGEAPAAIAKVLQAFNLPWIYDKYFPSTAPFAYSSSSTVSRLRVPLNMQQYENRATVLITFNVCFIETDFAAYEGVDTVNIDTVYKVASDDNT